MSQSAPRYLKVRDLGLCGYEEALAIQQALVAARQRGEGVDTLLFVEHPPVFTVGRRRTARANVLEAGDTPVVEVSRGGDVTWHGPGQLVGYPILALAPDERDLHRTLRRLEDAIIAALADVLGAAGRRARRREGYTGVWCDEKKIASLGVAVQGWVTFHGFALNVDPDLAWFQRINPCGLESQVMGSLASLGAPIPPAADLRQHLAAAVAHAFERELLPDAETPEER
ncbi:MAG: lipoyl(octanoyl) transferase LipB [Myxococcota bacterium]